jgi:hypothetical protein
LRKIALTKSWGDFLGDPIGLSVTGCRRVEFSMILLRGLDMLSKRRLFFKSPFDFLAPLSPLRRGMEW